MFDLIAALLSWFYNLYPSYGSAIGMLTVVVLVLATPLTLKGTASMLKMQVLQPELKAIQDKYGKDEREEMNVELMAFYKDNNINPVGGCVPMLFQIPVFLVLYRVIIGLTRRATDVGFQLGEVVGSRATGSTAVVYDSDATANFNPAYLDPDTALFDDLTSSNEMTSLGFDISRSASQVLSDGVVDALPYLLLVLVVGLSGWFQHKMIRSRQTGAPVNPTQEMIMKFMPFFLPVFSFTLPAAIVIYFLVSNIYRIGQQYYITRSMYHGDDSLGAQVRRSREAAEKSNKASGGKGGSKASGGKGGGQKGSARNGSAKGAQRSTTKTATKSGARGAGARNGSKKKPTNVSRGAAPGRNSSGKQGSARTQVQPKARKKKKR